MILIVQDTTVLIFLVIDFAEVSRAGLSSATNPGSPFSVQPEPNRDAVSCLFRQRRPG